MVGVREEFKQALINGLCKAGLNIFYLKKEEEKKKRIEGFFFKREKRGRKGVFFRPCERRLFKPYYSMQSPDRRIKVRALVIKKGSE